MIKKRAAPPYKMYVNGPPAGGGPCWAPEPVAPSCPERAGAVHISKNIFLSGLAIFFPGVLGEPVPFPGAARSGGAAPPYWRSRLSGGPYRAISSILANFVVSTSFLCCAPEIKAGASPSTSPRHSRESESCRRNCSLVLCAH